MSKKEEQKKQANTIMLVYPFALLLIALLINWFAFGIKAPNIALPSIEYIYALVIAASLLLINHSWLMTTTEIIRVRFKIYATPEERKASEIKRIETSKEGKDELSRRHNAHRNATENTLYFILLSFIFVIVSPAVLAVQAWIIGYAVARLGYTYSYLAGHDNVRGLFMSLSLLSLYGMTSYLVLSLFM